MVERKDFSLKFTYDIHGDDNALLNTQYRYWEKNDVFYEDTISITNSTIMIKGGRQKMESLQDVFSNISLPLYEELLRSLIYIYFTKGKHLQYGDIEAYYGGALVETINTENIQTIFVKDLPDDYLLPETLCILLFKNTWATKLLTTSMVEFIYAFEKEASDAEIRLFEYWKSFNTLCKLLTKMKKPEVIDPQDDDQLKCVREFIEHSFSVDKEKSAKTAAGMFDDLSHLNIKQWLATRKKLNAATEEKKWNRMANVVLSISSADLLELMQNTISKKLKSYDIPKSIQEKIAAHVHNHTEINKIEYLTFFVIRYGYFLRCKHFHGESYTPFFLLKETDETKEILMILGLLKQSTIDLYKHDEFIEMIRNTQN